MNTIKLSLVVENTSGVLSRVAGLFSRRGYNIDSLTVGATDDSNLSRMTVVASGEKQVLIQIKKQLSKLVDVLSIKELPKGESVCRELVLVKVECAPEDRERVTVVADIFRANIVDISKKTMTISLTGDQSKIEAFIELLEGTQELKIKETARTGVTGLTRGTLDEKKEV